MRYHVKYGGITYLFAFFIDIFVESTNGDNTEVISLLEPMDKQMLVIHRTQVKHDFLFYFDDSAILNKCINVKMIDPRGIEENGVSYVWGSNRASIHI